MIFNLNNLWFRFGLPLGSALLLVGILDGAMNFITVWMDWTGELVSHYTVVPNTEIVTVGTIGVVLWTICNIGLLWTGILKKSRPALTAWIVTKSLESICFCLIWIHTLYKFWGQWTYFFQETYVLIVYVLVNGYTLFVGLQCIEALRVNHPLDPIGLGFKRILKFYLDDASLGTKLLLITELVLIGEYLFVRQMYLPGSRYYENRGHESDRSAAIIAEEYVIRGIRFIISSVGLYLLSKGNITHLKYWCFAYLGAVIASLGVFIYLILMWNAEHVVYTLGYYLMFLGSLGLRCSVLYFCVKVLEPFMSTTTVPYDSGIEAESRSAPPANSIYSHQRDGPLPVCEYELRT